MALLKEFKQRWLAGKFCPADKTVLVAVSGGIDSMVLADLFLRSGIKFAVAHCNFQLRGAESDLDEQLVTYWCFLHNTVLHKVSFDTLAKLEEWKKGTQETARILRYDWFEKVRQQHDYAGIVTAHHANDNAETLLMNLFKGTGISGLHGILPFQNKVIRPLLFAQRYDIKLHSAEHNVIYREDSSNASQDYLRNAVRHNIVPEIVSLFPNAISSLNASIARFTEAELLYKKGLAIEMKKLVERRGKDLYVPVYKLKKCAPLATVCYELIKPFGFSSAQVEHVLSLLSSESGHYVQSPGHRIIRNREFLIITSIPTETTDFILVEFAPVAVDTATHRFTFEQIEKPKELNPDPNIAFIDARRVEYPIILRKWKTGDYFYPLGMEMKKKKVSRVLINEKVALHEKENIWVIETAKRIAWLSGIRLDERFKIKDSTTKVLKITRSPL